MSDLGCMVYKSLLLSTPWSVITGNQVSEPEVSLKTLVGSDTPFTM